MGSEVYRETIERQQELDTVALFARICDDLVGPDAYWSGEADERPATSRWGNLWCLPFPPTVVS